MKKYLFVSMLLFPFSTYSQNNNKQVSFQPSVIDFGTIPNDTILTAKFVLENKTKNKIAINYVNPECSCTSYHVGKYMLNPKDTTYITLTINTAGKFGKQKIYTIVNYGKDETMKKLTIKCNVYEK